MEIAVLDSIIEKLGHRLSQVRVGALKSLKFKLDNAIVDAADLVHRKDAAKSLLEWFNRDEIPMKGEVLDLLHRLVACSSGVDTLNSLGAMQYLSRLRGSLDVEHRSQIDAIVEKLLHLPPNRSLAEISIPSSTLTIEANDATSLPEAIVPTLDQAIVEPSCRSPPDSYFPLVQLSSNDEQILDSATAQLHGSELDLLVKSCHFARDVLFSDFPAEVFLQRPRLVDALMKLVSRGGHANDVLSTVAMDCIAVLADKIRLRVKSSRDPALVSAKGLDVDDSDNQVDLPVHVPIEEFGLQVMIASLSATKSDLLVPSALCAISKAIRLIEVWSFFANTFLIETQGSLLCQALQDFGDRLFHLSHQLATCDATSCRFSLLANSRAALAVALARFIRSALNADESDSIPLSLQQSISTLVIDQSMYLVHPFVREKLEAYMQKADQKQYKVFVGALSLIESFNSLHRCLSNEQDLETIEAGIPALIYYPVEGFVDMALGSCFDASGNQREKTKAVNVVLKLLAHPSEKVRVVSYQLIAGKLKNITHEALIWEREIIGEVAAFGLFDTTKEIAASSLKILTKLFVLLDTSPSLFSSLEAFLPYIEGCLGDDNEFNHVVMRHLNPFTERDDKQSPLSEGTKRVESLCRLFCSRNARIRGWALSAVCQRLFGKDPRAVCAAEVDSLNDIFMPQFGFSLDILSTGSPSRVDDKSILRLFSVLLSTDIDVSLRKSAGGQLIIALRNRDVHSAVLEAGMVYKLVGMALELVEEDRKSGTIGLLPNVTSLLYLLSLANASVCEELRGDIGFYKALIKGGLSLLDEKELEMCQRTSYLFHVVLFRQVALSTKENDNDSQIILSKHLTDKFSLFLTGASCLSQHRLKCEIPLSDANGNGELQQMLRISWHLTMFGDDVEATLEHSHETSAPCPLSERDVALLRSLLPDTAIRTELRLLEGADSHTDALDVLERLKLVLLPLELGGNRGTVAADRLEKVIDDVTRSFDRFLSVIPSNCDDEHFLNSIFGLFDRYLVVLSSSTGKPLFRWLKSHFNAESSAINFCLRDNSSQDESQFLFYSAVSLCTALWNKESASNDWKWNTVLDSFLQRLKLDHQRGNFTLRVLEIVLQNLFLITDKFCWSCKQLPDYSIRFLMSLIKILNVYNNSRTGAVDSFMGKGIIRNSAHCLLHVAGEMRLGSRDWVNLAVKQSIEENAKSPFCWLWSLVNDREPEVRCAGFGLSSLLCESVVGCQALFPSIGEDSQWLWHKASACAFDSNEACIVRQKAMEFLTVVAQIGAEVVPFDIIESLLKGDILARISSDLARFDPSSCLRFAAVLPSPPRGISMATTPIVSRNPYSLSVNSVSISRLPSPGATSTPHDRRTDVEEDCEIVSSSLVESYCRFLKCFINLSPQEVSSNIVKRAIAMHLARIVTDWPSWNESLDISDGFARFQLYRLTDALAEVLSFAQALIIHDVESCKELSSSQIMSSSFALWRFGNRMVFGETVWKMFEQLSCYQRIVLGFSCNAESEIDSFLSCCADREFLEAFLNVLRIRLESNGLFPVHQLALFSEILAKLFSSARLRERFLSFLEESSDSLVNGKAIFLMLLKSWDSPMKSAKRKTALSAALKAILAISIVAKNAALEAGFLETTFSHLKDKVGQLKAIESTPRMSQSGRKKAEEPLLKEVVLDLAVLNNALANSEDAKIAAIENGIVDILLPLWSLGLVYHKLMKSLLRLLVTFTGHCQQASASLLHSQFSGVSLLHNVLQLTGKLLTVDADRSSLQSAEQLNLLFQLLSNVAFNSECVSVIWKNNLLSHFVAMTKNPSKKSNEEKRLGLWLNFLVNVTFTKEGQRMVAKLHDIIPFIIDQAQRLNAKIRTQALSLLVLRNASVNPTARLSIQSNGNALSFLVRCAESSNSTISEPALCTLQALTNSSQKVRSLLRGVHSQDQK
ncbi:rotatin-like isoform X1 [Oscarella lobularis]|uniref:rotatin-like isoform X1 n=1 Tax=Oscarella lobularis TaxID=121494 RepID=UPI00331366B5